MLPTRVVLRPPSQLLRARALSVSISSRSGMKPQPMMTIVASTPPRQKVPMFPPPPLPVVPTLSRMQKIDTRLHSMAPPQQIPPIPSPSTTPNVQLSAPAVCPFPPITTSLPTGAIRKAMKRLHRSTISPTLRPPQTLHSAPLAVPTRLQRRPNKWSALRRLLLRRPTSPLLPLPSLNPPPQLLLSRIRLLQSRHHRDQSQNSRKAAVSSCNCRFQFWSCRPTSKTTLPPDPIDRHQALRCLTSHSRAETWPCFLRLVPIPHLTLVLVSLYFLRFLHASFSSRFMFINASIAVNVPEQIITCDQTFATGFPVRLWQPQLCPISSNRLYLQFFPCSQLSVVIGCPLFCGDHFRVATHCMNRKRAHSHLAVM